MSPPMPALSGSTTPSIAAVATAASAAFPPSCRIWRPTWAASGWLVATTPCRASTSDRVWSSQYQLRSPRTAVMLLAGFGILPVGIPNGVGEVPPVPAGAAVATIRAERARTTNETPRLPAAPALRSLMSPPFPDRLSPRLDRSREVLLLTLTRLPCQRDVPTRGSFRHDDVSRLVQRLSPAHAA